MRLRRINPTLTSGLLVALRLAVHIPEAHVFGLVCGIALAGVLITLSSGLHLQQTMFGLATNDVGAADRAKMAKTQLHQADIFWACFSCCLLIRVAELVHYQGAMFTLRYSWSLPPCIAWLGVGAILGIARSSPARYAQLNRLFLRIAPFYGYIRLTLLYYLWPSMLYAGFKVQPAPTNDVINATRVAHAREQQLATDYPAVYLSIVLMYMVALLQLASIFDSKLKELGFFFIFVSVRQYWISTTHRDLDVELDFEYNLRRWRITRGTVILPGTLMIACGLSAYLFRSTVTLQRRQEQEVRSNALVISHYATTREVAVDI